MYKRLSLLLLAALLLFGCAQPGETPPGNDGKLKVVASFYPMYDFAKNIGGERVDVSIIMPPGVSPHEFEPSPSAIRRLAEADVFIYNGAGMEPWVPNLLHGVGNTKLLAVDSSGNVELIKPQNQGDSGTDPHVWLDPVLVKKQVANIRDAFAQADPAGKDYYSANAAAYDAKLDSLDASIRLAFSSCKKTDILITHATLGYFCKEYGCTQIPIEGVSEEGEPSPAELVKIVEQAKAKKVTAVFFESLISPKSAQTIANEINGQVLAFNTVHGVTPEEEARGENYLSLMEENLVNIKKGLDCG